MMTAPSHAHRGSSHWAPESRSGRWAVSLAGLALAGTVSLAIAFAAGLEPGDTFSDNRLVTGTGAVILASAIASVVAGGVARTRHDDHGRSVVAATVVGVLLTLSTLQQVAEGLGWMTG
ncbi:hypothetical protein GCM10011376_06610 [Nocardioides flavus (ex Wang et al. 2016)]|uniref:Uncharacterized protein n=1 Tax=Nocardioides flavus (ex Wang et al. 2016) TaxID=2058780 RepID=A0ABQ3HH51_9ACTN|nr:hypothetical protein [Nocardioides flavus (ex Wang et al. 2016)]GHE15953.1 hypothetical protein GCM10011376_06610 [Nocardioides flavus (ex Wang et al. 2016)]